MCRSLLPPAELGARRLFDKMRGMALENFHPLIRRWFAKRERACFGSF
jgi:hypothetical protein